jgi:hypothetical protein
VQHFERLTMHQLREIPMRADVIFMLNEDHEINFSRGLNEINYG